MTETEHHKAFQAFLESVKTDFMYMGKDAQYLYFKHANTRKGVQIPISQECGWSDWIHFD